MRILNYKKNNKGQLKDPYFVGKRIELEIGGVSNLSGLEVIQE